MVRAILAGAKTQTRRVVKPQPAEHLDGFAGIAHNVRGPIWRSGLPTIDLCPYGVPGDRLWVRETFWHVRQDQQEMIGFSDGVVKLCAGNTTLTTPPPDGHAGYGEAWKHCPSIHMPRWASRVTLEIIDVRVQRVQEISAADARAEGMESCTPADQFRVLWDSINAERGFGWNINPWVWAITFRRVESERRAA
jgi:hypothetical protein